MTCTTLTSTAKDLYLLKWIPVQCFILCLELIVIFFIGLYRIHITVAPRKLILSLNFTSHLHKDIVVVRVSHQKCVEGRFLAQELLLIYCEKKRKIRGVLKK